MFVSSSSWDQLVAKGVAYGRLEADEGGYFRHVVSVHPLARRTQTLTIGENHDLVEFGFDALPGGASVRALRLVYTPLYVARAILGMRAIIKRRSIDVVRGTDPYIAGFVAWAATRGTRAHFCVSIHADWDVRHRLDPSSGAPKLFGSRRLAKVLERFVLARAELVLCIRRTLFDYAIASGARPDTLRFIPHGIDLAPFRVTTRAPDVLEAAGKRLLVFAGRVSRENYVDDLIALAGRLRDLDDVLLVIAGDGPERARIEARLDREPDLAGRVELTGFLPRDQVTALRMAAAVNLAPMGGFSLIEACASGRPTIAYDVEWHRELIEDGLSGRLVAESDLDALEAATRRLLAEPAAAARMGAEGRSRAFELHELAQVQTLRAAVYAELMATGERT